MASVFPRLLLLLVRYTKLPRRGFQKRRVTVPGCDSGFAAARRHVLRQCDEVVSPRLRFVVSSSERLGLVNGKLSIQSGARRGTAVLAYVPLMQKDQSTAIAG